MAITLERIAEDTNLTVAQVLKKPGIVDLLETHSTKKTGAKKMAHARSPVAYKLWRLANNLSNTLAHLA